MFCSSWDTGYIVLRPHSFKGGKYHFLWQPYDLYGKIDLIYSRRFYEEFNGFTAAQGEICRLLIAPLYRITG